MASTSRRRNTSGAFQALNTLTSSGKLGEINAAPISTPPAAESEPAADETPSALVEDLPAAQHPNAASPAAPGREPGEASEPSSSPPANQAITSPEPGGDSGKEAAAAAVASEPPAAAMPPAPAPTEPLPDTEDPKASESAHEVSANASAQVPPARQQYGPGETSAVATVVADRPAVMPAFPSAAGFMERAPEGLPTVLAQKLRGLPEAYLILAKSYRGARNARPGAPGRAKRNVRLHVDLVQSLTQRLVKDKRLLNIRDLKLSHYVDAALTYAQRAEVSVLIEHAYQFKEEHLGEENAFADPNHYTISRENNDWLDDMIDELMVAQANGLHGHMINVVIQAFLREFEPAE